MKTTQTRRRFLTTLPLVGAASLVRAPPLRAAEGPEVTSVRIVKIPGDCLAPQYIAEESYERRGSPISVMSRSRGTPSPNRSRAEKLISDSILRRIQSP
jgi:hypothetical protein